MVPTLQRGNPVRRSGVSTSGRGSVQGAYQRLAQWNDQDLS